MVFTMKVDFKKGQLPVVKAFLSIQTDHSIKVVSKITPSQVQESSFILPMAQITQGYGEMIVLMAEEFKSTLMVVTLKANSKTVKNMDKENTHLLMAKYLKEVSTRVIFQVLLS